MFFLRLFIFLVEFAHGGFARFVFLFTCLNIEFKIELNRESAARKFGGLTEDTVIVCEVLLLFYFIFFLFLGTD